VVGNDLSNDLSNDLYNGHSNDLFGDSDYRTSELARSPEGRDLRI
jgi:hypothetical protein